MESEYSASAQSKYQLAAQICNASSLTEACLLFKLYAPLLKDCKFIFASEKGPVPGLAINHNFSDNAVVRSLFSTSNVFVLDSDTIREMDNGTAVFRIDYSISLDTQAVSYIEPFLAGRDEKLPKDIAEVFEFMARPEVNLDPLPYLQENLFNIQNMSNAEKIFSKLVGYEILRTLDLDLLKEKKEVQSKSDTADLYRRAQRHMSDLYRDSSNEKLISELIKTKNIIYAILLKMSIIQIKNPRKSIKNKLTNFLDFCDKSLAIISIREGIVAKEFFSRGQKLEFFSIVQKNKEDLFQKLHGMVWDLLHIRHLELCMTLRPIAEARYFFPALLTFDRGLIEIMDLFSMKACAFIEGTPYPFYSKGITDIFPEDLNAGENLLNTYFSDTAKISRNQRRSACMKKLSRLVDKLERELCDVANIKANPLATENISQIFPFTLQVDKKNNCGQFIV